jgi:hypothetical protein
MYARLSRKYRHKSALFEIPAGLLFPLFDLFLDFVFMPNSIAVEEGTLGLGEIALTLIL